MLAALRASVARSPRLSAGLATASRPLRNANSLNSDLDRLQDAVREEGQKQQEQRSSAATGTRVLTCRIISLIVPQLSLLVGSLRRGMGSVAGRYVL